MTVGISLLQVRIPYTGVEKASIRLVERLAAAGLGGEIVVFADTRTLPEVAALAGNLRVVHIALPSRRLLWLWEHLFFLFDRRARCVDVVHFPIGGGVVGYRRKFILTIHDLKHYLNRELVLLHRHLLWRIWGKLNFRRASVIITISEYVQGEVLCEFKLDRASVRVVKNGVDLRFRPCDATPEFRNRYHLPQRYILFVGATSPNKNLKRGIEGVAQALHGREEAACFVIAGSEGEADAELKEWVGGCGLDRLVRFLGYIDDDDLPELYANARLFLFPSINEGFGIPPLEAMRSGVPVVAGRISSMPEILGDAPIWVDPLSIVSIADGVNRGLFDEGARQAAITRGFAQAGEYSWEKMASQTLEIYREVEKPQVAHGARNPMAEPVAGDLAPEPAAGDDRR